VSDVEIGKADAWVGSYHKEAEFAVYPVYAFDADHVVALFKKGRFDKTLGKEVFNGRYVGWIRGYQYHRYLGIDETEYLLNNIKSGILMVANDRLDFYIDARVEIESELNKGYVEMASMDIMDIEMLKIYMAFSPNFRGNQLKDIWDQRMQALHDSGELQSLYKKYMSYTSFYPINEKSGSITKNKN
jgi:polar amino acid transport system substrate-binding protein